MLRMITVVGTRPEFIRSSVMSRLIRKDYGDLVKEYVVNTGQHYDRTLAGVFFEQLQMARPDVDLDVRSGGHAEQTAKMLVELEKIFFRQEPDIVVVHGDTNSTLAGALAASKLRMPVAHIEAGLRSGDRGMAEEQNRILSDHLSTKLYCPSENAVGNLSREGIFAGVKLVGDLSFDAYRLYSSLLENEPQQLNLDLPERYVLLTLHRAENTDCPTRLREIVNAVNELDDRTVIFPMHPRTRSAFDRAGLSLAGHVRIVNPVGFLEMLVLEARCSLVMTDSGGIQKEAYFFKKPCITMRDSTEWIETVRSGWNRLVGADRQEIVETVRTFELPSDHPSLYGEEVVSAKIMADLLNEF